MGSPVIIILGWDCRTLEAVLCLSEGKWHAGEVMVCGSEGRINLECSIGIGIWWDQVRSAGLYSSMLFSETMARVSKSIKGLPGNRLDLGEL